MTPEQFKNRRVELGYTQDELADKLLVDPRTVRRYEQNEDMLGHRAVPPRIIRDMNKMEKKETTHATA